MLGASMGSADDNPTMTQERLSDVLAAYLEAVDGGWAPKRESFLGRYPELAFDLAQFFANEDRITGLTGSLNVAIPGNSGVRSRESEESETPVFSEPPTVPQNGSGLLGISSSIPGLRDYELLEEISRGGMGVVYRARQRSLNRTVALKMIL